MNRILTFLFAFVALPLMAANPSFQDFNTNQFNTASNKISIKTNATIFTNLPFQDLSMSLNTFGDSIVSGEAGPPGWVYIMDTNLNDATEIINFGGSGYQQHNVTAAFLGSGGHTNEPYLMEIAYNGYTADPAVDGSNRLYWIRVAVSNTPSPKRFLLLQMPNDQSSSNSTARYAFTTNLNATIAALYPNNYYAWWDWFRQQTNGSAQENAEYAAGIPPSSLMNADGIHPNSAGNYRLGTNMAGIWRAFLRSYQQPLLTGDMPLWTRGQTNVDWSFKNISLGVPDLYVATTGETESGNIRMSTNGAITWLGPKIRGGLQFFSPGIYGTVLKVDPDTGYLTVAHSSLATPIVDAIFDPFGGLTVRTNLAVPEIQLGLYTAAVPHNIYSISYGSDVASAQIATYSDTAAIVPRTIWTTSESGSPGTSRVIVTNANFVVAPANTMHGNASGVSNAVTLIALGCIQITSNVDGRTFGIGLAGSGSDVLTNSRAAATLSGLTLLGITTNGAAGGSNWVGGISLWNPATGNTINLTNGVVQVGAGTAALPSYSFFGDPDTGIYNTANTINFSTGGAIRSWVNSEGISLLGGASVGLNLANASGKRIVFNGDGVAANQSEISADNAANLTLKTATGGTNRVTLSAMGLVSTNLTTANTALTLNGAASGAAGIVFRYNTNNIDKATLDNAGNLSLSGTITAPTITLTNNPTLQTTNAAPAGFIIGTTLPVVWFAVTNAGNKYLIPGYAP